MKNKINLFMKNSFIILSLILTLTSTYSQKWDVPAIDATKNSHISFDAETRKKGEKIYINSCQSCHGQSGKNNPAKIVPIPKDPASKEYQANTDGELYYKITIGRGAMPQFKTALSEEDRWFVISYVRSFNTNYKQKEIIASVKEKANARLSSSYNHSDSTIIIWVSDSNAKPIKNAEVTLYAIRYFGKLPIGDPVVTDNAGYARFKQTSDLPGNTNGKINIKAKLSNEDQYGHASIDTFVIAFVKNKHRNMRDERAMWNSARKAPLWITCTYLGAVLIIVSLIVYVLLLLKKIKEKGSNN